MKEVKVYIVVDIGCIECGEDSDVVGIFKTREEAEKAIKTYITNEPNEFGSDWGRKDWTGQHDVIIFKKTIDFDKLTK